MQGGIEGHIIIFSFCCWLFKGFPFQKLLFGSYGKLNSAGMSLLFSPCFLHCAHTNQIRLQVSFQFEEGKGESTLFLLSVISW